MPDRLTGLETFISAVRLGSLSAAARSLGISPTMAVRHLEALEARLGTTLLLRTTRRLSLTEAGRHFLERSERVLSDLAEAEAEASAVTVAVEGPLRVTAPAVFGMMHLADMLPGFTERYPNVSIELGLNDRVVDLLDERWDMAIRIGHLDDSTLVARKLADMRLVLCAAPAYLRRRGTPRLASELGGHDCLGYVLSERTSPSLWRFGRDGSMRVAVRGPLAADNGHVLMTAAIGGQGLLYGPRFVAADALRAGHLVEIVIDVPLADMGAAYAVSHPTRRPTARLRAWIDYLAERVRAAAADW